MPQTRKLPAAATLNYYSKEKENWQGKSEKKSANLHPLAFYTTEFTSPRHGRRYILGISPLLLSSPRCGVPRQRDDRGWVRRLRSRLGLEELAISQPGTQPRAPPPHHAKIARAGDPGLHPITRKSRVLGTPGCATRVSRDLASCCAT